MTKRITGADPATVDVGGDGQDELFDALSDPRRRFVLQHLQSVETPTSVGDLSTDVAAWEERRPTADPPPDDEAVTVSLVHKHLPMLSRAGLVEYDAAAGSIEPGGRTEEVRSQLRAMTVDE